MSAENKALVRRWFEQVWNKGRVETIDELLADRSVVHGLGEDMHGPAAFKAFHAAYRDAFPDLVIKIEHMIADDEVVALRWSAAATHSGGGLGFAATGKRAQFTGMAFVRVEGGRFVEGWNSFDQLGLLQQLGVVTLPAAG
jgi:steroid delta-isomerase-like uncharacterized protein